MKYIEVNQDNCKSCYKCLKVCMVKSIKFDDDDKANIVDKECVLCGRCVDVCPQEARYVNTDLSKIKNWLNDENIKTFVSIAPSYLSVFEKNFKKIAGVIKQLGFDYAEETAVGASYATTEYCKIINEGKKNNIITTTCPTINMLITKYYPELTGYLAPVLSPMLIHGKLIKEKYGKDIKVIFIGPCLSMVKEADDFNQYVDAAMTFNQFVQMIDDNGISIDEIEEIPFNQKSSYSRIYPIKDGILMDLRCKLDGYNLNGKAGRYTTVSVSGLHEVRSLLEEIERGEVNNVFAEVNACRGGCVNGSMQPNNDGAWYKDRIMITEYASEAEQSKCDFTENISRKFISENVSGNMPTEEEIQAILQHIGKFSKEQELNCGSCGYSSCREKAIAVYQKKADIYMCLAYMTDINQTLSNVILSVTPNIIIAVDKNMIIKEFNVAAQRLFKISRNEALNKPLSNFISTENFEKVFKEKKNLLDIKVKYDNLDIITNQKIAYSENENVAVAIITDITKAEASKEKNYKTKLESVDMAQKVIEKQMMVAQEIASLLGETTAETKVTLNKLKSLIEDEGFKKNE